MLIAKQRGDSGYSQEEIELVKAVAAQARLIIECLGNLQKQTGRQARELVLHEVDRLNRDFLTLASHELRTPLTGIKGNLQLSQRRLETLKRHLAEQPERASAHLEHAQQSLAQAAQSARLQERMVRDLIDDARIQANQLGLSLKSCDLLALINVAVMKQQASVPEHTIELENLTTEHTMPVLADAGRITQVLTLYLANALNYSPAERPVTVQVRSSDDLVRVSVHDEGAGIPLEEQGRLWDRFYRGKGSAVQHELDLSLGLSFYLSQALIERHHGSVGVESEPGHGATFWFTLPIARSAA
ncbi:histidine kinase [Ktedonobacter racemifer DSM 44963]|uniref:histidine kinase n=1 Tax=Ktedonobacter racemifer DSM 44963 TaxID=485913 RepID=D6TIP3_KTERA|nr:histidine kinase [Ktedonobacter racemifer DSM 44963]